MERQRSKFALCQASTRSSWWDGTFPSAPHSPCTRPRGNAATALLSTTTSTGGAIPEAFAYTDISVNHYNRFILRLSPHLPATPRRMPQ
jgi:hypothetical protein